MPKSTKRLGPRYGRRIRDKLDAIETAQKTKYKCPYCHKIAVRRLAVGIWNCTKCDSTFTGKAYSVKKANIFEEESGPEAALVEIKPEKEREQASAKEQPVEETVAEEQ